jgi:hypothetical protein
MKQILFLLLLTTVIYGNCSNSKAFWQNKIAQSQNLETFFLQNHPCQRSFYPALNNAQKIYFDTVVYPHNLTQEQYQNRWFSMSLQEDVDFFKRFTFFNNYFSTHKNSITSKQLGCFQRQQGFQQRVSKKHFYSALSLQGREHDVAYLYPLIRWAYVNKGIDMRLSAKRVKSGESVFGMQRGKVGDSEQFARYMALFDEEYEHVASILAQKINISKLNAYKLLVIITYLESRGNLFAVSKTGAFGPMQLTLHYYMMYGEPNNPFNPKSSLIKLANKFVHYHRVGRSVDASVIAYKSGSLEKCRNGLAQNSADCKYYNDYKSYMSKMRHLQNKSDISRYMTGKSYFYSELRILKRVKNTKDFKAYEPYQYAVLKRGSLSHKAQKSLYMTGESFRSLGKMKRSEIYQLQDRYGKHNIGVISDKKVCW